MAEHFGSDILGPEDDTKVVEIASPYNGALLATLETQGWVQANTALEVASALFQDRSNWLSPAQRSSILQLTALKLTEAHEEFALRISQEGGKPLLDARVEVTRAIEGLEIAARTIHTLAGHEIPMNLNGVSRNHMAFTRFEPKGVVVAITAFNHPLNQVTHPIACSIAAGCPIIIKPAEDTPLSCIALVALLREAGLPKNFCQIIHLWDKNLSERLATDPRVGLLHFTGSAAVGWRLRSLIAPGTDCILEHGGASALIIAPDVPEEECIAPIIKSAFTHAGQLCVSLQRLFVHYKMAKKIGKLLAEAAGNLKIGDPTSEKTTLGPMIRKPELKRVHRWVSSAIESGGKVLCGGKPQSDTCYPATIILDPSPKCELSTEEVFGPVLAIYTYENLETAITKANALPFQFQSSIFTKNIDIALYAGQHMKANTVLINEIPSFRVDWMPFEGSQRSGLGVGGIEPTIRKMSQAKLWIFKSPGLDALTLKT